MFFQELSLRNEAEIFAVIRTAFAVPPWNDDWRDEASFHAYLVDILGNRNSLGLGLWYGGALIALALGRVKHWFDGIEYCIDDLCVRPDNQERGVGSALLRHIREYACEKGFQRVSLSTNRTAPGLCILQKKRLYRSVRARLHGHALCARAFSWRLKFRPAFARRSRNSVKTGLPRNLPNARALRKKSAR